MATATYKGNCPHCGTKGGGFESIYFQIIEGSHERLSVDAVMACNNCKKCLIVELDVSKGSSMLGNGGSFYFQIPEDRRYSFVSRISGTYPKIQALEAPADVPPNIAGVFIEAQENYRQNNFETSGMLSRKAIDLSTQVILGDTESQGNLNRRIQKIKSKGLITDSLTEWADIVRDDGNDPTHKSGNFTKEDAKDLLEMTRAFLMYVFTLPKMVSRRRPPAEQ